MRGRRATSANLWATPWWDDSHTADDVPVGGQGGHQRSPFNGTADVSFAVGAYEQHRIRGRLTQTRQLAFPDQPDLEVGIGSPSDISTLRMRSAGPPQVASQMRVPGLCSPSASRQQHAVELAVRASSRYRQCLRQTALSSRATLPKAPTMLEHHPGSIARCGAQSAHRSRWPIAEQASRHSEPNSSCRGQGPGRPRPRRYPATDMRGRETAALRRPLRGRRVPGGGTLCRRHCRPARSTTRLSRR